MILIWNWYKNISRTTRMATSSRFLFLMWIKLTKVETKYNDWDIDDRKEESRPQIVKFNGPKENNIDSLHIEENYVRKYEQDPFFWQLFCCQAHLGKFLYNTPLFGTFMGPSGEHSSYPFLFQLFLVARLLWTSP